MELGVFQLFVEILVSVSYIMVLPQGLSYVVNLQHLNEKSKS